MTDGVTIVDFGVGNLLSVQRAFEVCGARVYITSSGRDVLAAERLVLPGVGAFGDGMSALAAAGLITPLRDYAASGRPLLGICLGMQMLATAGEEYGEHAGLNIIRGRVVRIPSVGVDGRPHKIPHIGWSALRQTDNGASWDDTILEGLEDGATAYHVHSYTFVPEEPSHRLADCYYDGCLIAAAVRVGNVYGCQFHPEKSGKVGLHVVRRFKSLG